MSVTVSFNYHCFTKTTLHAFCACHIHVEHGGMGGGCLYDTKIIII